MSDVFGFDSVMPSKIVNMDRTSITANCSHIVHSSEELGGTFVESIDSMTPPVRIGNDYRKVGFFGGDMDLLAFESGDTLKVVIFRFMRTILSVRIRPGSLFVPAYGDSRLIGALSPNGRVFFVNDGGEIIKTPYTVREGSIPIWSSSTSWGPRFLGQAWGDSTGSNLELASERGNGAVAHSDSGMNVYSGVDTYHSGDGTTAFFATLDEPHLLKQFDSMSRAHGRQDAGSSQSMRVVASLNPGGIIDHLVTDHNDRPVSIVGYNSIVPDIKSISGENRLTELIRNTILTPGTHTDVRHMGFSTLGIWSQTPATEPRVSIMDYGVKGREKHEVRSQVPVKNEVRENAVATIRTSDRQMLDYRLVSKFNSANHMLERAVIIPDPDSRVLGGEFSPTVKMLVDMNIPVVIMAVNHRKTTKDTIRNLALDIRDVANDVLRRRIARTVSVLASGSVIEAAVRNSQNPKSSISSTILFRPTGKDLAAVEEKKASSVINCLYIPAEGDLGDDSGTTNPIYVRGSLLDDSTRMILEGSISSILRDIL